MWLGGESLVGEGVVGWLAKERLVVGERLMVGEGLVEKRLDVAGWWVEERLVGEGSAKESALFG